MPRPPFESAARGIGWGALVLLAATTGCVIVEDEKGPDEGGDDASGSESTWGGGAVDTGGGEDGGSADSVTVTVDWGETGFTLDVDDAGAWKLGMAETGGSCGGSVPCWTGEDCFLGFDAGDGVSYGPWCHDVEGGSVALEYGGQMSDLEAGTTVFRSDFADTVTYLLLPDGADRAGGACYVFGDQPSYFADLGCVVLSR